jgi:hypothetical protein
VTTSAFLRYDQLFIDTHSHSCFAHRSDLDGQGKKDRRSQDIMDQVKETFTKKQAWADWGVVSDVLVWKNTPGTEQLCKQF